MPGRQHHQAGWPFGPVSRARIAAPVSLPNSHPRLAKRTFTLAELIADGVVHVLALVAGLIAFAVLLARVTAHGTLAESLALAVYALGFFLMFGFSLAYNMAPPSTLKWLLRRFDHSSIYLMIAGTYTALLVQLGYHSWTLALAIVVWAGALGGIAIKLLLPGRYDGISVVFFLLLGFSGLAAAVPLYHLLPAPTLALLLIGGLIYAGGVAFYKWHRLPFHNVIWHACVAMAAGLHFAAVAFAFPVSG
jgi:hemolysin III